MKHHQQLRLRQLARRCRPSTMRSLLVVTLLTLMVGFLLPSGCAAGGLLSSSSSSSNNNKKRSSSSTTTTTVAVFAAMPSQDADAAVARKQQYDLERMAGLLHNNDGALLLGGATVVVVTVQYLTVEQQRAFLRERGENCVTTTTTATSETTTAAAVFDTLPEGSSMQTEVFKWCALATATADTSLWLDSSSPILSTAALQTTLSLTRSSSSSSSSIHENVAVLDDSNSIIHGSYLQLRNTEANKLLARRMLQLLLQTELAVLQTHALLVPRALHDLISKENGKDWYYLHLSCRKGTAKQQQESRSHLTCPTGYCCSIQDVAAEATLMMSRHYVIPYQSLPGHDQLPAPFNAAAAAAGDKDNEIAERPFISTITVKELPADPNNDKETSPNLYDVLAKDKCLPDHDSCTKCLREKKGATCASCASRCPCYCEKLCHVPVPAKRMAQEWTVSPPLYAKDPTRLIPRIVHQTWFEELNAEAYPNMSRLVESFKQSGWEYRFYTDDAAAAFLRTHFPPAVLDAYQALTPGAFKADLFRYCVLLISGGVYADVDIQLESALDISIPPDVGFMVPVDEPGKPVNKQMCLWNGFIASAPNHPFLAKAIETVVNQVRNRFTSVDIDATFCPHPELSVLHAYDTLFTAGPCLLGSSLNRVLGRNGQTSHVPGELHGLWSGKQRELSKQGTSFVFTGAGDDSDDESHLEHRIPGRTIILYQNKWDMGAHRFTFLEQNLVVVATDLPDSNDRDKVSENAGDDEKHEHYSKAHAKTGVYGVEHLYKDQKRVNEDIRIVIDASMHAKKQIMAVL